MISGELPTRVTLGVHVEHKRAWIDDPERAVNLEQVDPDRHFQPLANDDLKDVAAADILTHLLTASSNRSLVKFDL